MYTVSKNKNDYFYYLVKLRRCTKIETLIIRFSVLGVQNRFQLSRTFLPLCNFLAPPSVSRVNYTRIRLLSMRGYLRSALYLYNSVVLWFIAQLSCARALLCASTLNGNSFFFFFFFMIQCILHLILQTWKVWKKIVIVIIWMKCSSMMLW